MVKEVLEDQSRLNVDLLCQDTGQTPAEIKTCMENRHVWRAITDVDGESG